MSDLLEEYSEMIHEPDPELIPSVRNIMDEIKDIITVTASEYIGRTTDTIRSGYYSVGESSDHIHGDPAHWTVGTIPAETLTFNSPEPPAEALNTLRGYTTAASFRVPTLGLQDLGSSWLTTESIQGPSASITRDGIVTYNDDGSEAIRIDTSGIHINGRLIVDAEGRLPQLNMEAQTNGSIGGV